MKTFATLATILIMTATMSAQTFNEKKTETIVNNYIKNLDSPADQVVSSTLVQILKLKAHYPEFPTEEIKKALVPITQHKNSVVAYNAFLVSRIIDNDKLLSGYKNISEENVNEYFAQLALEMNTEMFAASH